MTRNDIILFALWSAAVLLILGRPLAGPGAAMANFGDLYTFHHPLRHLAVSGLQSGHLPFWNPYIFCGLPLAANPQSVLFYPVALLGTVLPLVLAFSWDYAFHLLWGGLGIMLLARREGLSAAAGLFLATLYCLCPIVVYRIIEGIPTLLASLSWVPWCWLALLSRRRGLLAAVWALQLLSGHPQFLVINLTGMALWCFLRADRLAWTTRCAAEGAGALLLSFVQWLPTAEFVARSVRRDWPAAYASAYTMVPKALLTSLHPGSLGNPLDGTFASVPSYFFETTGLFIGWLGLAAAGYGLWKGRRWPALLLIGLGLALAMGAPLGPSGLLRTPSRNLLLALWGLLLAAGAAARRLEPRIKPGVKALLLATAFAELLAWDARFLRSEDPQPFLQPNHAIARVVAGQPLRVLTDPELASPDKTMFYRAMNVNGYDAFYLRGYPAFAARSEGAAAADSSRTYLRRADSPLMKLAGVAFAITPAGGLVRQPRPLDLAFPAAQATPIAASLSVQILRPERWLIRGRMPPEADRLVISIPAYPGWRAELNGKNALLEPWDYFQSVRLPPHDGRHGYLSLVLDFRPPLWTLLCLVTALAWAGLLSLFAGTLPLPRR